MSQAASQAAAFYRDVAKNRKMWAVRDGDGFVIFGKPGSMPFWSTLSRVKKMISVMEHLSGTEPVEISWEEFYNEWVPKLERDKIQGRCQPGRAREPSATTSSPTVSFSVSSIRIVCTPYEPDSTSG